MNFRTVGQKDSEGSSPQESGAQKKQSKLNINYDWQLQLQALKGVGLLEF